MDWRQIAGMIAVVAVISGAGGWWMNSPKKEDPVVALAKEVKEMRVAAEKEKKEDAAKKELAVKEAEITAEAGKKAAKAIDDRVAAGLKKAIEPLEKAAADAKAEKDALEKAQVLARAMLAEARKEAEAILLKKQEEDRRQEEKLKALLEADAKRRAEEQKKIDDAVEKRIKDLLPPVSPTKKAPTPISKAKSPSLVGTKNALGIYITPSMQDQYWASEIAAQVNGQQREWRQDAISQKAATVAGWHQSQANQWGAYSNLLQKK